MLRGGNQRGDTIIEVLFAITIFSLVAVGGLALMNQGTAMAQRSLEISLVREQMDTQTDALHYLRDGYVADNGNGGQATAVWQDVVKRALPAGENVQDFSTIASGTTCVLPSPDQSFTLDVTKLTSNPILTPKADAATYARVRYDQSTPSAEGLWIQAIAGKTTGVGQPGYYDFHIRACWQTPGQTVPVTLGTIVRLYVPTT